MNDLISIIVTSYNYEKFIPQTLDSLISQTHENWEAIVIDDGSTDTSLSIIEEYEKNEPRIRLLQHPGGQNKGLISSVKLALSDARGSWIAFCESDDWWCPLFLQYSLQNARDNPSAGLVFSDVLLEGVSTSMEIHCNMVREHFRNGGNEIGFLKKACNAVPTFSCAMVKKEYIMQCDFNPHFKPALDMWLWAQVATITKFLFIDMPLVHWRQHDESYMKKSVLPGSYDPILINEFNNKVKNLINISSIRKSMVKIVGNSIEKEDLLRSNRQEIAHLKNMLRYTNSKLVMNRLALYAALVDANNVVNNKWWKRTRILRNLSNFIRKLRGKPKRYWAKEFTLRYYLDEE